MPLDAIAGRAYGPFGFEVAAAKVSELVAASGDDPKRWAEVAPPSFAATVLFGAAQAFLADSDVAPHLGSLIHNEQQYLWHRPTPVGAALSVSGEVEAVRTRRELHFVTFRIDVTSGGEPMMTLRSVFLMADAGAAAAALEDEGEPGWDERGPTAIPTAVALPEPGDELPPLPKSASRADLVRYAGATGDFNAIHWDHDAARAAGLPGVICHGLLTGAWMLQAAARLAPHRPDPIADAQVRFRKALRPAAAAEVGGELTAVADGTATVKLRTTVGDDVVATGSATVNVR